MIQHEDAYTTIGQDADGTVRVKLRKRPETDAERSERIEAEWRDAHVPGVPTLRCSCRPAGLSLGGVPVRTIDAACPAHGRYEGPHACLMDSRPLAFDVNA